MQDKHFVPLSDLTKREHEVLHIIARELILPESPQQTSNHIDSAECDDLKVDPTLMGSAWRHSRKD